jgi:hypothetical protein
VLESLPFASTFVFIFFACRPVSECFFITYRVDPVQQIWQSPFEDRTNRRPPPEFQAQMDDRSPKHSSSSHVDQSRDYNLNYLNMHVPDHTGWSISLGASPMQRT